LIGAHGLCVAGTAPTGTYENTLKTTDIEKVTGLKGVKVVPRDPAKGASGMMNFADAQGVGFTATFEIITPEALAKTKASSTWKGMIKGPVSGVGDEAYSGPKNGEPFILIFKKGKNWVTVSTGLNPMTMKPKIPMEKMQAIASIMASRLQ
jgi:hypothetical protein